MNKNLYILSNFFFVLIIVFNILGCTRKLNLNGVYYSKNAKSTLSFNESKVFNFRFSFATKQLYSSGIWNRIDKRNFQLNSNFQNKDILLVVNKSYVSNINLYNVKLHLPFQILDNHKVLFFLNNSLSKVYSVDTIDNFLEVSNLNEFDSIYFGLTADTRLPYRYLDTLFTQKFTFLGKENNVNLAMNYNDSFFNYKVFTKQIVKLRRNGILFNNKFYKKVKKNSQTY